MSKMEISGAWVEVDEEGYLVNFEDWNEQIACTLAEREGIADHCPLTRERMDILKFLRDYYQKFRSFPIVQSVCKNVHQPKNCQSEQFFDPIKAWKISGLPKPTTEVYAYIKHKAP
jgi:TusE/DsrC/DsvC family sulfur relay protein